MTKKNKILIISLLTALVIGAAVAAVLFFKPSESVSAVERIKKELAAFSKLKKGFGRKTVRF